MADKKVVFVAFAIEDEGQRTMLKGQSLHFGASPPSATFRGARRTAGPTTERVRNTKQTPTSSAAPRLILRPTVLAAQPRSQLHAPGSGTPDGELLSYGDLPRR